MSPENMEKNFNIDFKNISEDGFNTLSLYGIDFKIKESSTKEYFPIEDIAKKTHTSVDHIKSVLKKYDIMNSEGEISETKTPFINVKGVKDEIAFAWFVLNPILRLIKKIPDGMDIPEAVEKKYYADLPEICGHQYFITKLLELDNRNN